MGRRSLLLVVGLYLLDRYLSLTGLPFLQLSIWGGEIPSAFSAAVYAKFWIRILIVLLAVRASLTYLGENKADIFLVRPSPRNIALGAVFSLAMILITNSIEGLWRSYGLQIPIGTAGILLASGVGDWATLFAIFIPAAFYEEILYSFIVVHLRESFDQSRVGFGFAILATSTLFGLTHLYQGELAFLMSFTRRMFYCLLLFWRKNLTAPITAHAIYNLNAVIPLR